MGFCRNLHCFYLEGEETLRKISICSLYLQSLTGEAPRFLDWGLTECFGDSQGVTGSALWACRIWKLPGSDAISCGKAAKSQTEASIPSRNFNTFKKKIKTKHITSRTCCSLQVRADFPAQEDRDGNVLVMLFWFLSLLRGLLSCHSFMLRIHFSRPWFCSQISFSLTFFVVRERKKKTAEDKHLVIRICKFVAKGNVNVVPVFTQNLLSAIKSH